MQPTGSPSALSHEFTACLWRGPARRCSPPNSVEAFLKSRFETAFDIVNKHLAAQPFIVGEAPTIADISMCGYLFFPPEESGYDIAKQYPNIGAWLARVREIPGWCDPYEALPGERIKPKR